MEALIVKNEQVDLFNKLQQIVAILQLHFIMDYSLPAGWILVLESWCVPMLLCSDLHKPSCFHPFSHIIFLLGRWRSTWRWRMVSLGPCMPSRALQNGTANNSMSSLTTWCRMLTFMDCWIIWREKQSALRRLNTTWLQGFCWVSSPWQTHSFGSCYTLRRILRCWTRSGRMRRNFLQSSWNFCARIRHPLPFWCHTWP